MNHRRDTFWQHPRMIPKQLYVFRNLFISLPAEKKKFLMHLYTITENGLHSLVYIIVMNFFSYHLRHPVLSGKVWYIVLNSDPLK